MTPFLKSRREVGNHGLHIGGSRGDGEQQDYSRYMLVLKPMRNPGKDVEQ